MLTYHILGEEMVEFMDVCRALQILCANTPSMLIASCNAGVALATVEELFGT